MAQWVKHLPGKPENLSLVQKSMYLWLSMIFMYAIACRYTCAYIRAHTHFKNKTKENAVLSLHLILNSLICFVFFEAILM